MMMREENQEQINEEVLGEQDQSQHTDSDNSAVSQDNQTNEHDTQSHDDSGDWTNPEYRNSQMAAVRKKAEEKAAERARQEVLRELEEQYIQQQQAQQSQTNGESPNLQNQPQPNQPSQDDFMRVQKFNAYGEARYDDWKDSINALSREAQINPAIVDVVTVAANLDNGHDIVNKIAKDPKLRQELTECRPEALAKKMIRIGMQESAPSQPKLAPRKPLSEINPALSSAGSNEVSYQQKLKGNIDRIAKKMNG
jgi:hypothetical protein